LRAWADQHAILHRALGDPDKPAALNCRTASLGRLDSLRGAPFGFNGCRATRGGQLFLKLQPFTGCHDFAGGGRTPSEG